MDGLPFSRRDFVASAGTLGAVTIFAPQALAQELSARKRKAPTLRGGRFKEGILSGDPTPRGITLWTRVAGVEGRAAWSSRSRATAAFAASWPAS